MLSLVIPVYRNEDSLPELLTAVRALHRAANGDFEAVFVVDGSPDRCVDLLTEALPAAAFSAQLVVLSRNFGSFAAVRAGLAHARGSFFAVMTADLQEPPELMLEFVRLLQSGRYDVVVGVRRSRTDGFLTNLFSNLFWRLYRALVQREMPSGGVDVFACNSIFRDQLLRLGEHNTSLVGLICWLGFRCGDVLYDRRPRRFGRSAWSFARRVRYVLDSAFAFSDLPVRLLSLIGLAGMLSSVTLGAVVLAARLRGDIAVPGYAATVIAIMFFGGLNSLGLGLIGEYLWRTFENTKQRPTYVVAQRLDFQASPTPDGTTP
jgi:glycosyltransferase involved in cell wall biosynthesis